MSLNTSQYNWGEQLKGAVKELPSKPGGSFGGGNKPPSGPIPVGKHAGFVESIKHGTFKTGSYGITFTYVFEEGAVKNRNIREIIVLRKADGTDVKYAASRLTQRLMNLGLALEKINAFKAPRNEHDLGDFALVLGAPVTVSVAEDKDKDGTIRTNPTTGAPYRRVQAVYSREVTA